MPPSYDTFLEHLKSLRSAVLAARAELLVAGETIQALVRQGSRRLVLHPQFLTVVGAGALRARLQEGSSLFAGWRPYVSRSWALASDRAAFRRVVRGAGLSAPDLLGEPPPDTAVVVSSLSAGSGRSVEGPFRPKSARPLDGARGEAYEPFVRGDLVKVWFWAGAPVCAELERTPRVAGDGSASIRDLVARAATLGGVPAGELEPLLSSCERVLRADGLDLATVLPAGVDRPVGLGYGASAIHGGRGRVDLDAAPWADAMRRTGSAVLATLPRESGADTLFTVDAIVDEGGRPWVLDLDSNPVVHPLAYPAMMKTLLAPARGAAASPEPPGRRPEPAPPIQALRQNGSTP